MWSKEATGWNNPYVMIATAGAEGVSQDVICRDPVPADAPEPPLAVIAVVHPNQGDSPLPFSMDIGPVSHDVIRIAVLTGGEKEIQPEIVTLPRGFDAAFSVTENVGESFAYRLARALLRPLGETQELNCDPNDIRALVRQGNRADRCYASFGKGSGPDAGGDAALMAIGELSSVLKRREPGGILISVLAPTRDAMITGARKASQAVTGWNESVAHIVSGEICGNLCPGKVEVDLFFFSGPSSTAKDRCGWVVSEMPENDIPMFLRSSA